MQNEKKNDFMSSVLLKTIKVYIHEGDRLNGREKKISPLSSIVWYNIPSFLY